LLNQLRRQPPKAQQLPNPLRRLLLLGCNILNRSSTNNLFPNRICFSQQQRQLLINMGGIMLELTACWVRSSS